MQVPGAPWLLSSTIITAPPKSTRRGAGTPLALGQAWATAADTVVFRHLRHFRELCLGSAELQAMRVGSATVTESGEGGGPSTRTPGTLAFQGGLSQHRAGLPGTTHRAGRRVPTHKSRGRVRRYLRRRDRGQSWERCHRHVAMSPAVPVVLWGCPPAQELRKWLSSWGTSPLPADNTRETGFGGVCWEIPAFCNIKSVFCVVLFSFQEGFPGPPPQPLRMFCQCLHGGRYSPGESADRCFQNLPAPSLLPRRACLAVHGGSGDVRAGAAH